MKILWDYVARAADDAAASSPASAPAGEASPASAPAGAAAHQAASDAAQQTAERAAGEFYKPAETVVGGKDEKPADPKPDDPKPDDKPADPKPDDKPASPDLAALEKAVTDAKTPEEKAAAETKLAEFKDAQPFTPDGVRMPEGVEVDKALMERFAPIAKDLGLDQKGGQKLVDHYIAIKEAEATQHAEQVVAWLNEAKADKDLGGAKWDGATRSAQLAVEKLGTPGLKEILNMSGLGNHPDMIKFASRVGELIKDDKLVTQTIGNTPAPKLTPEQAALKQLYPDTP